MTYEVKWTSRALDRLRELLRLVSEDRPKTARRLINRIFDRAQQLEEHPYLGRTFAGLPDGPIRQLTQDRYLLLYTVSEERQEVYILLVQHQREPEPDHSDLDVDPEELE